MATEGNGTSAGEVIPAGEAGQPMRAETLAAFEGMIRDVPEAGGDAFESILGVIARAGDVTELDAPWRSQGFDELVNVPIVIQAIRKMPSDFGGGLPWFLVVDAAIEDTGELTTFTTGAVSVVAQLVRAWSIGAFPLRCTLRQSDRPSKAGYYPQHLEIARRQAAPAKA